jgi:hypothetical protein
MRRAWALSGLASKEPQTLLPALLIHTSMPPETAAFASSRVWAGSVTWVGTATARPPSASQSRAACSSKALHRAARTTLAPRRAKARAVASPARLRQAGTRVEQDTPVPYRGHWDGRRSSSPATRPAGVAQSTIPAGRTLGFLEAQLAHCEPRSAAGGSARCWWTVCHSWRSRHSSCGEPALGCSRRQGRWLLVSEKARCPSSPTAATCPSGSPRGAPRWWSRPGASPDFTHW